MKIDTLNKHPNQTFNVDKNKNDKKVVHQIHMDKELSRQQAIKKCNQSQLLIQSKTFDQTNTQISESKIIPLSIKGQEVKNWEKMIEKSFRSLKTNQPRDLKTRNSQTLAK